MATTLIQARKLLNAAELDLFAASRGDALKALTPVNLRGKIKRVRTLRDKFQDLLQRQKVATRARTATKVGVDEAANARTATKVQVFEEMLARCEERLAQLDAAALRTAAKTAAVESKLVLLKQKQLQAAELAGRTPQRSAKAPARGPAGKPGLGAGSESALAARKAMQHKAAGQQRIQGHVASAGRRNQAKRDR